MATNIILIILFIFAIYLYISIFSTKKSKSKKYKNKRTGKIVKALPANNITGILLNGKQPIFRVYHPENKSLYVDLKICHEDMSIKIKDAGVYIYTDNDKSWLDHPPEALGYENED